MKNKDNFSFFFLLCIPSPTLAEVFPLLPLGLELPHFGGPALPDEFGDGFGERQIVVWPRGHVKGLQLYFSSLFGRSPHIQPRLAAQSASRFFYIFIRESSWIVRRWDGMELV